jgi:isoleucyl-tRNA synthetase
VPVAERAELDRWVLSRLQATADETAAAFDAYHPTRAARAVERFVDDLSNWYVRRSRRRFWKSDDDRDKRAAYQTLHTALEATARLMAPIAPFTAEWLYDALGGADSVHLAAFPEPDEDVRDRTLERRMALARGLSSAVLALRNEASINVRQPLGKMLVVTGPGGVDEADLRAVEAVVLDEVNVKALETVSSAAGVIERTARPNFRALGKRLGPKMKAAQAAIAALGDEALDAYVRDGALTIEVDGAPFDLREGDLEVAAHGLDGQLVAQQEADAGDGPPLRMTVALDPTLTDALRAEGLAREFVNRVQNLRKAAGYDVADRIAVAYAAPDEVAAALDAHGAYVRGETLAVALERADGPAGDRVQETDIGGFPVTLAVRRAT